MGKLMGSTLFSMFLLSMFMIFGGNSLVGMDQTAGVDGTQTLNGTDTTVLQGSTFAFYIDPVQGAIVLFTVLIGVAIVMGLQVLGSGIATDQGKTVTKFVYYTAFWVIFSAFGLPLLNAIPVFGGWLYLILTIGYVWGAVSEI